MNRQLDRVCVTEDKHFFSHNGVDYSCMPRVLGKVRVGALMERLATGGRHDNTSGRAIFPQGGSTITQQLVRGAVTAAIGRIFGVAMG